jgi:MazG family protein
VSASRSEITEALLRLDDLTRRLRRECPWDREQDERTIVPHTLEEAYELADAAHRRDDAKLLDELGDVLFQVHFLALLLEERGAGDLAAVAEHCRRKLIRRHPHVFGSVEDHGRPEADSRHRDAGLDGPRSITSGEVLRNWDRIKQGEAGREAGIFGEVPENLPSLLHARKVQRRAATSGFDFAGVEGPLQSVRDELDELEAVASGEGAEGDAARDARFHELGDVLFAAVNVARKLKVDPELALRAASERFRGRVEDASALAARDGRSWEDLSPDEQLAYYARGRLLREAASPRPGEPTE